MRIDIFLYENGYANSRTEAKNIVLEGVVSVNGKIVNKASFDVEDGAIVTVGERENKYVSRGGLKLEGALKTFDIDVNGRNAIDIGASTGGFTDCLLQNGASRVVAIDSGRMQLSPKLISDNRVYSIENYNARYLKAEDLPYKPDLAVMDVSFISATYIIPSIFDVLEENSDFICLVKPQFEVGRANVGKGGIVKDDKARILALQKVIEFAKCIGFNFVKESVSPIKGGDGNIEYLACFKKGNAMLDNEIIKKTVLE